ncbi:acyltransferase family protein [Neotamlana nanhaiensis]
MIIVNTPGTGAKLYPYLVHASWFGFTLADLVFPSFLFAMGNALSFSMGKMKTAPSNVFWKKIIKRTFLIFLFGFLMYWFPFFRAGVDGGIELKPIGETRVMGVLQRIALCYFATSVLVYYLKEKIVAIISVAILLLYWVILYVFGEPGAQLNMATNAIAKLDLFLLGNNHIYQKDSIPFDPEGILSTLPSIVNVIAGYFAGKYIQKAGKTFEGISILFLSGFLVTALALWWELIFPMSKKLWTSPFALYTIGLDLSIMAVLIYVIEIKQIKFGVEFFNIFGKNPLFIYLFSELFYITLRLIPVTPTQDAFEWFSEVVVQNIFPGSFGAFFTAILFMLVCWSLGWWLNKKRIYIKI